MATTRPPHATIHELDHGGARYLVIGRRVPRPSILMELTASELDVMDAWLAGSSMAEISAQRKVALRTVANQIASLYRKLKVGSRSELQTRIQQASDESPGP